MQVEGPDRPVERGADDDEAAGGEGDVGDAAGVLGEGDEAQAAVGVPHLHLQRCTCVYCTAVLPSFGFSTSPRAAHATHLAVVAPRHNVLSVRRERQRRHVVEVALLLEDVRLALPLPHQQLPLS